MTDRQHRAIQFIERMLEIKYNGTTDKDAWAFIGRNLKYAQKCQAFEAQMSMISIPVFSSRLGDAEPDLDLKRDLSRTLLIRDIQKGKDGLECVANFTGNLVIENLENEEGE